MSHSKFGHGLRSSCRPLETQKTCQNAKLAWSFPRFCSGPASLTPDSTIYTLVTDSIDLLLPRRSHHSLKTHRETELAVASTGAIFVGGMALVRSSEPVASMGDVRAGACARLRMMTRDRASWKSTGAKPHKEAS